MLKLLALLVAAAVPPPGQPSFVTWGANTVDAGVPGVLLDGGATTVYSDPMQPLAIVGGFAYTASIVCDVALPETSGSISLQLANDFNLFTDGGATWAPLAALTPQMLDGGWIGSGVAATLQLVTGASPQLRIAANQVQFNNDGGGPLICTYVFDRL